jgi:glycoside hydrolase-like protein
LHKRCERAMKPDGLRTFVLLAAGVAVSPQPMLLVAQSADPHSEQVRPDDRSSRDHDSQKARSAAPRSYYGFDRNDYPGDENLTWLRKTFAYAGYWLNAPPGAAANSWTGKRNLVEQAGFGFLVLFNGRLDADLKKSPDAARAGQADAAVAVEAARREGFPAGTVIFLDVEEGGRMLPEQKAYIYAWIDGVSTGGYRGGVYCSGIAASEGHGVTVVTANDLREHAGKRRILYWVANDACPPAPGCGLPKATPSPAQSGIGFAEVWQFAQSPRRAEMTRQCIAKYAPDQNCYAPGGSEENKIALDLDTANEADPSHGRTGVKER